MPNPMRLSLPVAAAFAAIAFAAPAAGAAETLRCRSVNGNLTCAGSGGVSCQTVDGRTTCVGGGGAVVQQFGSGGGGGGRATTPGRPAAPPPPAETDPDEDRDDDEVAPPPRPDRRRPGGGSHRLSIERHGPAGWMTLERDGPRLRLRTERLAVDTD